MTPESDVVWTRLDWDSNHFGFEIAKFIESDLSLRHLATEIKRARDSGVRCLYWLTTDQVISTLPKSPAIKILDRRVTYYRPLGYNMDACTTREPGIRVAEEHDLPFLREMAGESHRNTRFHEDGSFPRDLSEALYARWIERSFLDDDQVVFVSGDRGSISGYITCGPQTGSTVFEIGLIAVADTQRRLGIGQSLVVAAIDWAHAHKSRGIEVSTQGQNFSARRLYERNRFRLAAKRTWVHIWPEAGEVLRGKVDQVEELLF